MNPNRLIKELNEDQNGIGTESLRTLLRNQSRKEAIILAVLTCAMITLFIYTLQTKSMHKGNISMHQNEIDQITSLLDDCQGKKNLMIISFA